MDRIAGPRLCNFSDAVSSFFLSTLVSRQVPLEAFKEFLGYFDSPRMGYFKLSHNTFFNESHLLLLTSLLDNKDYFYSFLEYLIYNYALTDPWAFLEKLAQAANVDALREKAQAVCSPRLNSNIYLSYIYFLLMWEKSDEDFYKSPHDVDEWKHIVMKIVTMRKECPRAFIARVLEHDLFFVEQRIPEKYSFLLCLSLIPSLLKEPLEERKKMLSFILSFMKNHPNHKYFFVKLFYFSFNSNDESLFILDHLLNNESKLASFLYIDNDENKGLNSLGKSLFSAFFGYYLDKKNKGEAYSKLDWEIFRAFFKAINREYILEDKEEASSWNDIKQDYEMLQNVYKDLLEVHFGKKYQKSFASLMSEDIFGYSDSNCQHKATDTFFCCLEYLLTKKDSQVIHLFSDWRKYIEFLDKRRGHTGRHNSCYVDFILAKNFIEKNIEYKYDYLYSSPDRLLYKRNCLYTLEDEFFFLKICFTRAFMWKENNENNDENFPFLNYLRGKNYIEYSERLKNIIKETLQGFLETNISERYKSSYLCKLYALHERLSKNMNNLHWHDRDFPPNFYDYVLFLRKDGMLEKCLLPLEQQCISFFKNKFHIEYNCDPDINDSDALKRKKDVFRTGYNPSLEKFFYSAFKEVISKDKKNRQYDLSDNFSGGDVSSCLISFLSSFSCKESSDSVLRIILFALAELYHDQENTVYVEKIVRKIIIDSFDGKTLEELVNTLFFFITSIERGLALENNKKYNFSFLIPCVIEYFRDKDDALLDSLLKKCESSYDESSFSFAKNLIKEVKKSKYVLLCSLCNKQFPYQEERENNACFDCKKQASWYVGGAIGSLGLSSVVLNLSSATNNPSSDTFLLRESCDKVKSTTILETIKLYKKSILSTLGIVSSAYFFYRLYKVKNTSLERKNIQKDNIFFKK
jgi:hypothetical protein